MAESLRRNPVGLSVFLLVLGIWIIWFLFADVGVYQTATARLQAERDVHAVEASLDAKVVTIHMAVGKEVNIGDVLLELDDSAVKLRLAELQSRLTSIRQQQETIETELKEADRALADMQKAAPMRLDETRLHFEQALPAAQFAEEELSRWRALLAGGFATEAQVREREATARRLRSEVDEAHLAMTRQALDRNVAVGDRQVSIERLRRNELELTGLVAATTQIIKQTEHERENFILRAPAKGPLAEVADLRPGVIVRSGDRLATIVPNGDLKLVADFPQTSMGHLRVGQMADVRFDGFPPEQYGRLLAAVLRVSQEARVGKLRVELELRTHQSAFPLQHGLIGTVDVEVERIAPALLVLRAAGALLRKNVGQGSE